MKKTADAVIIGGGAVGTSTLYHLTKLGMTDVALLEKGNLASGSTGDSAAIVRQHYSNEVSIRLVKRSIEIMRSFPDEMGVDVFTQSGWCFLVPPEAESSIRRKHGAAAATRRPHMGDIGPGGRRAAPAGPQPRRHRPRGLRTGRRVRRPPCAMPRFRRPSARCRRQRVPQHPCDRHQDVRR